MRVEIDNTEAFATAAKLIHRIASGVLRDPKEDKFRRVNTGTSLKIYIPVAVARH